MQSGRSEWRSLESTQGKDQAQIIETQDQASSSVRPLLVSIRTRLRAHLLRQNTPPKRQGDGARKVETSNCK